LPTVVLSAYDVANKPEVGGHFWVYMQYALGLQRLGCDVYWIEWFTRRGEPRDAEAIATFLSRTARFGLGGKVILLTAPEKHAPMRACSFAGMPAAEAEAVIGAADLMLNFHYKVDPEFLARFRRTALVDIDPGLLQHWMHHGQIAIGDHDLWFTTGENVGRPGSLIPAAGKHWERIRPCVSVEHWPVALDASAAPMTTVSSWHGGEWVKGDQGFYENNKSASFLAYHELPKRVNQPLELALSYHAENDREELDVMRRGGWLIRHSFEVAGSPEAYQAYVQRSRAEFSCAKPSCARLQGAWISDRTLCYLASGKPVVVEDTGPSGYLPSGEGMFRFSTPEEAAAAIAAVNADYERHCRAARALAEEHFDAAKVAARLLEVGLA